MDKYFAFQWHITDSCDQRCKHCYIFSENKDIVLTEMSYQNIKQVLHNCLEMCQQLECIPYFYITGGDPLLHTEFWQVLELFREQQLQFGILGNSFHLTDEVCRKPMAVINTSYLLMDWKALMIRSIKLVPFVRH